MKPRKLIVGGKSTFYDIYPDGSIISHSFNHNGKHIKSHKSYNGYLRVPINVDKKRLTFSVHRLVALTFIPNPKNLPTVNHIDGNKQNNNMDNLEWASVKDNVLHAHKIGLRNYTGEKNPKARLTNSQVRQIFKLRGKLTQIKIAEKFNVSRSAISCIFSGQNWKFIKAELQNL